MHLKRYTMPKFWPPEKKRYVYIVRPLPGPHSLKKCMPLQIIVEDILGLAETRKEAKTVLGTKKIMIDKKVRTGLRFPVGFMDILEITDPQQHYRMDINKAGIFLDKITAADAESKIYKIVGKKIVRGGGFQLNLHDGTNMLIGKKPGFHIGDSIMVSLADKKIIKHMKLEKGAQVKIIDGKNIGEQGIIKEIRKKKNMLEKSIVIITTKQGNDIETLYDYIFVGDSS